MPEGKELTNSIGMRLVRIEPGVFRMGAGRTPLPPESDPLRKSSMKGPPRLEGDFDERPSHRVEITRRFYMGATEVTNAQYEQFDPSHAELRGKLGFSKEDDEAVVFVRWQEAMDFCRWLTEKEGLPYRLPTEAEWEYACRAGTTAYFHTGDTLPKEFHKNARLSWFPGTPRAGNYDVEQDIVPLRVGETPPNPWGLYDMHGNVEEWCHDWYGPYEAAEQVDPVGRADGDFRVARGGSHSTRVYYLRSANRMAVIPEDRHWLIGLRVVIGESPKTRPLPASQPPLNQRDVSQEVPEDLAHGPDPSVPYFKGPRQYMSVEPRGVQPGSYGPAYNHENHEPAIVACPNGDLLATWYTCVNELRRELCLLASRLRRGQEEWEPASPFWDPPDRNLGGHALWFDERDTIYQFSGLAASTTWASCAVTMRTSRDSGATWSKAQLIAAEHGGRHEVSESVFETREGYIVLPCDYDGRCGPPWPNAEAPRYGTALYISRDGGRSWEDTGTCDGIHAGIVQLRDGRLLAFGRSDGGPMPKSLSEDMGKTWTFSEAPFPGIGGGQRLVLKRLREGPLFFAAFAKEMRVTDASGDERPASGLFAALSSDEGETWPVRRLITDDGPGRQIESLWDGRIATLNISNAEEGGYLAACQARNGIIHLLSDRQHYAFNLAWLKTPPPSAAPAHDRGAEGSGVDGRAEREG